MTYLAQTQHFSSENVEMSCDDDVGGVDLGQQMNCRTTVLEDTVCCYLYSVHCHHDRNVLTSAVLNQLLALSALMINAKKRRYAWKDESKIKWSHEGKKTKNSKGIRNGTVGAVVLVLKIAADRSLGDLTHSVTYPPQAQTPPLPRALPCADHMEIWETESCCYAEYSRPKAPMSLVLKVWQLRESANL